MARDNVETTRRALEHFNSGNREALREMTADSAEIIPLRAALEGTAYRGPNALADFWAAVDDTWEFVRMHADEIVDHGDQVLIVGRLQGRARGTDVDVDSPVAWVMTLNDDGKMTRMHTYTDIAKARRDAGVAE